MSEDEALKMLAKAINRSSNDVFELGMDYGKEAIEMKEKCQELLGMASPTGILSNIIAPSHCKNNAKYFEYDKWYCGIHAPSQINEREKIRLQKRKEEENQRDSNKINEVLQPQWTPISKGLPPSGQRCIWQKDESTMMIGYLNSDADKVYRSGGNSFEWLSEFIAWVPLPKPYQGSE